MKNQLMNEPAKEYKEIGWTLWPEDVLEGLDIMLVYVGIHDQLILKGINEPKKIGGTDVFYMKRALPTRAIVAARSLLYLKMCHPANGGKRMHWFVPNKPTPRDRLVIAGIDIDTLEIINRRRWAFAFRQITTPPYGFSQYKNIELDDSKLPTPELTPLNFEFRKYADGSKKKKVVQEQEVVRAQEVEYPTIGDSFGARRPDY